VPSEEDQAMATGNMYKKLVKLRIKFGHVVFELCEWTETEILITVLCTHPRGWG